MIGGFLETFLFVHLKQVLVSQTVLEPADPVATVDLGGEDMVEDEQIGSSE